MFFRFLTIPTHSQIIISCSIERSMRPSFTEHTQSPGIADHPNPSSTAYNLTGGLRAVYCGSAFLPAFVLDECHGIFFTSLILSPFKKIFFP